MFQGHKPGFTYARQGNPTNAALEAKLNLLEESRATICFGTGMAAISATFFALLRAGDHVVSSRYVFGNTASVLRLSGRGGAATEYQACVRGDDRQSVHSGGGPCDESSLSRGRERAGVRVRALQGDCQAGAFCCNDGL